MAGRLTESEGDANGSGGADDNPTATAPELAALGVTTSSTSRSHVSPNAVQALVRELLHEDHGNPNLVAVLMDKGTQRDRASGTDTHFLLPFGAASKCPRPVDTFITTS